jgi:hypothetical protein
MWKATLEIWWSVEGTFIIDYSHVYRILRSIRIFPLQLRVSFLSYITYQTTAFEGAVQVNNRG